MAYGTGALMGQIEISSIKVGKRHRRDLGDVEALARSIAEIGLLHPVVVRSDGKLIAGERRVAAFKHLGRDKIPATVVNLEKVVLGEYAENTFRKNFTPSEVADIADALEPVEKAKARERMVAGKSPAGNSRRVRRAPTALDRVAKIVGKDRRTIEKARAICDAAKKEPVRFAKLKDDMDRTGRVDGPYRRLKVMRQAIEIRREPPPLPGHGPYRVIVVDPPWPYKRDNDPSHRVVSPYASASIEEIKKLNVASIAHKDCILWLWVTNHHMREAFEILDAWDFEQKTILTWGKDKMGMGDWLRGKTEHCVLAVRGKPVVELKNQTTLLIAPVRKHSQKPIEFYDFVEKLCPAPRYADIFSRYQHNKKWDCHGGEAPNICCMNEEPIGNGQVVARAC
jgi:ParB/RepB/Spo0J family partition protein